MMRVLGVGVGGRVSQDSLIVVRRAFQWLADGTVAIGRQVDALLGHLVLVTLFRRAGILAPRALRVPSYMCSVPDDERWAVGAAAFPCDPRGSDPRSAVKLRGLMARG